MASHLCGHCQQPDATKRCRGCQIVWYCSAAHQTAAWSEHKGRKKTKKERQQAENDAGSILAQLAATTPSREENSRSLYVVCVDWRWKQSAENSPRRQGRHQLCRIRRLHSSTCCGSRRTCELPRSSRSLQQGRWRWIRSDSRSLSRRESRLYCIIVRCSRCEQCHIQGRNNSSIPSLRIRPSASVPGAHWAQCSAGPRRWWRLHSSICCGSSRTCELSRCSRSNIGAGLDKQDDIGNAPIHIACCKARPVKHLPIYPLHLHLKFEHNEAFWAGVCLEEFRDWVTEIGGSYI